MSGKESDDTLVRYYCTAGNGMETFLIGEIKRKLAAEDVCQISGKVLFSSSASINRIRELKAAERLFLLLKEDSPLKLSVHTSQAKAASVLQSRLLDDKHQWLSAVVTWSRLQGELDSSKTPVKTFRAALGVTRKEEEEREEERKKAPRKEWDECTIEARKSIGKQWEEELSSDGKKTMERKRKRVDEEEEERRNKDSLDAKAEKNPQELELCTKEVTKVTEEISSCRRNGKQQSATHGKYLTPGPKHNVESSSRIVEETVKNTAVDNLEKVKTSEDRDLTLLTACRSKTQPSSGSSFSFRISCKCTGSLSRCFSTQEVSRVVGVGVSRLLGWKVDLKNPQLEINVNLSDDHCLLGIPLTRSPLANRSYIKSTGLRSTVAWAMASLAQIQPGFSVVDPMCGVGTILIEAAQEHKEACFLGMDIDDEQLQKANGNVAFAELGNRMHLLKASTMTLPLASASVDAVICDLPFGRKFSTKTTMAASLPLILSEMERVLCPGGVLVLLLTPQLSCVLKKLLIQKGTGPTSNQETRPHAGGENSPSPSPAPTEQQSLHSGVKPSPATESQTEPTTLTSLKHQATYRVSLGAIDGLIHKYIKKEA